MNKVLVLGGSGLVGKAIIGQMTPIHGLFWALSYKGGLYYGRD